MSDAFQDFDNRLRRIQKARVKLADGYVSVVGEDGLIVVKPRRKRRGFPLRALSFVILGFFGFKIMILTVLGQPVYAERVAALQAGSSIEQAGAVVMQADPLSLAVADWLRRQMR